MKTEFVPSPYQAEIFRFVREEISSAIIEAVAGSGKTTTIVKSLEQIAPNLQVLFLAFNKAIAEELKTRVPKNVKAATFHSVGFGAWMSANRGRRINVDSNKLRNLCREWLGERDLQDYGAFVSKLVGLAKGMGIGYLVPDIEASWFDLMDHFDIYLDTERQEVTEHRGVELARLILKKSVEQAESVIDFDDMLYMPLIRDCRFVKYDLVFVDEAQDTNAVQVALLKRMLKPGGRLVAVGDPHQAIYGFRGADSDAMARIAEEFGCVALPLTVSYRCPQAVVRAAQEFVSHIEAHESAPEGVVERLADLDPKTLREGDAILCRVTAPLVETAYGLIRQAVPCKILGREIGVGLVALVKKMQAKTIDSLEEKLDKFLNREVAKLSSKGREDKAQAVDDKVTTLRVIISHLGENRRTVAGLVEAIESLFTDNGRGMLTLATVHKAKGLEWQRVFILGRDQYMPSKWARKAWQKQQEVNLIYVAYTRSKSELYFISEGFYNPKKEKKDEVK